LTYKGLSAPNAEMRVLISAYACEPGGGSELGKGWNFASELACQGHDVVVLSCGSHHRQPIEAYGARHGMPPGLTFAWHDVPHWPGPGYVNARFIRQHYLAWQITARRRVAQLQAEQPFDVIHHLTWTVLRWPSFLWGLGPRFVFGPVGGGEGAPWPLRRGFPRRGWKVELQRDVINMWSRIDPLVLLCLKNADAILVTDEATRRHVPSRWHGKTTVVADIFAPLVRNDAIRAGARAAPAILFAGRLEYWKGAQLALGALAKLRVDIPHASLTIAGSGPEESYLRSVAAALGLSDCVDFIGSVPHEKMAALYSGHDIFLFPSLHDSGPHVIGEALANGMPVVCLDLGGPGIAIDRTCGTVIRTAGADRAAAEAALAKALADMIENPEALARLSQGALLRAQGFSYTSRVRDAVERFYRAAPEEVRAPAPGKRREAGWTGTAQLDRNADGTAAPPL
jgi:glycosyltransferase involved in cell wall biosynthesis